MSSNSCNYIDYGGEWGWRPLNSRLELRMAVCCRSKSLGARPFCVWHKKRRCSCGLWSYISVACLSLYSYHASTATLLMSLIKLYQVQNDLIMISIRTSFLHSNTIMKKRWTLLKHLTNNRVLATSFFRDISLTGVHVPGSFSRDVYTLIICRKTTSMNGH